MRTAFCVAGIVAVLVNAPAPPQEPQRPRFVSSVDTVEVYATVRGRDGQLVANLTRDDFTLLDNGRPREITIFSNDIQPITMAFLLDRSGSIGHESTNVTSAAEAFVARLLDEDRASIQSLTYNCQPLTADKAALVAMLRASERLGDPGSPIWPGLDRTISSLGQEPGRRAILMFSDGNDEGSFVEREQRVELRRRPGPCPPATELRRTSAGEVARRAARDGLMVYAVGVESPTGLTMGEDLRSIALDSGGEFFWLTKGAALSATFTRIADELHHQYVLGFTPGAFDGKEHRIDVRSTRAGVTVRARARYLADRDATGARTGATRPVVQPVPAPSASEIEQAIADGLAGRQRQAACTAKGMFGGNAAESSAGAAVTIEGPTGGIMRLAREAAERHEPFTVAQVPDELRASVLRVTAELITNPAVDTGPRHVPAKRPPSLSPLTVLRFWSGAPAPIALHPLSAVWPSALGGASYGARRLTTTFDLAAFRALPGTDVDVVVYSNAGERTCTIGAAERSAIR